MKPIPYIPRSSLQRPAEALLILPLGGVFYYLFEVAVRGRSHHSMAVCGAVCLWFMYRINQKYAHATRLARAWLSTLFITALEFCVGCVCNLYLGLDIWDYSALPYNLLGQISLSHSAMWFLLSYAGDGLCTWIGRKVFLSNV